MPIPSRELGRRSIRLKGYDYSRAGFYFVTICTKDRECLFGKIKDNQIILNTLGHLIKDVWENIHKRYSDVVLDEYILMPNHIHGIIEIRVGATLAVAPNKVDDPTLAVAPNAAVRAGARPAPTAHDTSLGDIIGSFKSLCINEWIKNNVNDPIRQAANMWQRNFYERIIRTPTELIQERKYIQENPIKWQSDENNPKNIKK